MSAVLFGLNKIFGRAVNSEVKGRFGSERFDAAWRFRVRIFDDKIDMRLLVHVVEERKGRCKNKNANRCEQAKTDNRPPQFLFR